MNYSESDRISISFRIADDYKLALQRLAKEQNINLSGLLEKLAIEYIKNPLFQEDYKNQNTHLNTQVKRLKKEKLELQKKYEDLEIEVLKRQGVSASNEELIKMYEQLKEACVFSKKELFLLRFNLNYHTKEHPEIDRTTLIRAIFRNVFDNDFNLLFKTSLASSIRAIEDM